MRALRQTITITNTKRDATEAEIVEQPKRIEFYLTEYSIEILANKVRQGDFVVPAYQREFTWEDDRKSRFIESIIIDNCPADNAIEPVLVIGQIKWPRSNRLVSMQRPMPSCQTSFSRSPHRLTFDIPIRISSDRISLASLAWATAPHSPALCMRRDGDCLAGGASRLLP
jgi:hypothetical protein